PSRAPVTARERTRALLQEALATDPSLARAAYHLALLDLQDDRVREALERLDASPRPPGLVSWQVLRAQGLRARGLAEEADRVLAAAAAEAPRSCELLPALATAARERRDFSAEEELVGSLRACDATSSARADFCTLRGNQTCAAAEYARLLA